MKSINNYLNESLTKNDFKHIWIDLKTNGINKLRNGWNKIKSFISNNFYPPVPSIVVTTCVGEPSDYDRLIQGEGIPYYEPELDAICAYLSNEDLNYDCNIVFDAADSVSNIINQNFDNILSNEQKVVYAGGHIPFPIKIFKLDIKDTDNILDDWKSVVSACNKKFKKYKVMVDNYRHSNKLAISIEIENDGYFDYVFVDLYI